MLAGPGPAAPYADPLWYSRESSLYYNVSHERLGREIRAYVDEFIAPFADEWEKDGYVSAEALQRHAMRGYAAVSIFPLSPEHVPLDIPLPGDGKDRISGVIWGLSCGNSIGCPPVLNYGTPEQKAQFLPDVYASRSKFCLGITEPNAGSDVAGIKTTAERKGDVYVVNGAKKWITNGIYADWCTAAVRTGGSGKGGISALIIPLKARGVTRKKMQNSGVNASSTYIEFDDAEVLIANLLGNENEGFEIVISDFNHERIWLATTSLRLARVCAEDSYNYAIECEVFGKKLYGSQVIRAKLSSIGRQIDPASAYMEQLVYWMMVAHRDQNPKLRKIRHHQMGGLIANLKVMAGRVLENVTHEAQQVLGGTGYNRAGKGARVEQISRDVRVMGVGGGSDEILTELALNQEVRFLSAMAKL
ncbi:related to acyl-CoA dehydrogenase [Phialocephala subalpina]|uniref:Related to acyl-CoA dehydrogenase n=1 Tax=Phialocephala subalpina TaxID=576137 RepID=A0A1L7XVP0_9HELO|nr:related to acyl-CoA dehydrogenase [Phialocephala subalpina]